MSAENAAATFPPADFVRRGPPVTVENLDRSDQEKWARVVAVVPEETEGGYAFATRGPYTLPMAVRREDVDRGSQHAWTFFTHPYSVFPPEATYYNVAGKGCLGARIYHRAEEGIVIYDEVGAGIPAAEMVADSFAGGMGVLRRRALVAGGDPGDRAYTPALLEFDLDLLEVFRLTTLLLQATSPQHVLKNLALVLERPTIREFAREAFAEADLERIRSAARGGGSVSDFCVREEDFTKVTDVRDARNRLAIQELLSEWEAFEQEHGARLAELGRGIQEAEDNIARIKEHVKDLQSRDAGRGRISRFFSKDAQNLKQLKAEAVQNLRTMRELESAYHEIPGYDRLHGLSERVQEFQETIGSIYRLARDLFDENVTQAQLKAMRSIVRDRVAGDPAAVQAGLKSYDLRLRAEVLPRLLTTYSVSAYVLRRPDALPPRSHSRGSVQRVNRMARQLIEYFRYARYGSKTLGEAFDETWGQVLNIEGRL